MKRVRTVKWTWPEHVIRKKTQGGKTHRSIETKTAKIPSHDDIKKAADQDRYQKA